MTLVISSANDCFSTTSIARLTFVSIVTVCEMYRRRVDFYVGHRHFAQCDDRCKRLSCCWRSWKAIIGSRWADHEALLSTDSQTSCDWESENHCGHVTSVWRNSPAAPPSALPNVELMMSTLPTSTSQYSSVPLHTTHTQPACSWHQSKLY